MSGARHQPEYIGITTLPVELVQKILMQCSPVTAIHAAASCKFLRDIHRDMYRRLTEHTATFDGKTDGSTGLCNDNTWKLYLTLRDSKSISDCKKVYTDLETCIQQTRKSCNMQELAIQHETSGGLSLFTSARECMLQLLELVPNLQTLWMSSDMMIHLLGPYGWPSSVCRAGMQLYPNEYQLFHLPAMLPNLDTLCLTLKSSAHASYLEHLSGLSQLRYLSLQLAEPYLFRYRPCTPPHIHYIGSLKHVKVSCTPYFDEISFRGVSGLQQLDSLSVVNFKLVHPEVLASLNVSSLTLQSIGIGYDYDDNDGTRDDSDATGDGGDGDGYDENLDKEEEEERRQQQSNSCQNARMHYLAEPYWPKLNRLYLAGVVSEELLQAMLLPHPAARGLTVGLKSEAFDKFHTEYCAALMPQDAKESCLDAFLRIADILYLPDVTPILGPAYLAAAKATSVCVEGEFAEQGLEQLQQAEAPIQKLAVNITQEYLPLDYMVFPTMKELVLNQSQFSMEAWIDLLLDTPNLKKVTLNSEPDVASFRAAADELGIATMVTTKIISNPDGEGEYDSHICHLYRPPKQLEV